MDFTTKDTELDRFVDAIDLGDVGLPEFQRQFLWKPGQVVDLMRSVAKRWPTGALLVLEGKLTFAARPIESGPRLRARPKFLVLDGQQRLTSAYHAFQNRSEEVYYLDLGAAGEGRDTDDCFRTTARTRFEGAHPSRVSCAKSGVITIADFRDDKAFFEWVRHASPVTAELAQELRGDEWAGLRRNVYRMPTTYLPDDTKLEAIAKVFETVNRTGIQLSTFDLMTAATYHHADDFNLRRDWEAAKESEPLFDEFEVDGVEPLRLLALILRKRKNRASIGVRQPDVLKLKATEVRELWPEAVGRYADALRFAKNHLGVASEALVPSAAMLLTLGYALSEEIDRSSVATWWWHAAFGQTYAQGANTVVTSDADHLQDALPPEHQTVPWKVFQDKRRRNEILLRAALGGLLASGDPLNPLDGDPVASAVGGELVDIAPIWPLEDGNDSAGAIANFALVRGNKAAIRHAKRVGVRDALLELGKRSATVAASQRIDAALLAQRMDPFIRARSKQLAELAASLMGVDT